MIKALAIALIVFLYVPMAWSADLMDSKSIGKKASRSSAKEMSIGGKCASSAQSCADAVISLNLKDVKLRDFLREVSRKYRLDMVISQNVTGTVSATLSEMPVLEAVDAVLQGSCCQRRELAGGRHLIEGADSASLAERGLVVREFTLVHALADEGLKEALRGVLSEVGSVVVLPSGNSIIVKDIPLALKRAEDFIKAYDRVSGQVVIEARVVEVERDKSLGLGIEWGGGYHEVSGNVFGGLGSVDSNFAVNLPGVHGETGLALGIGVVSDKVTLNLQISALEQTGEAKTIASPRVQVVENTKAVISDGISLLIPSASSSTVISTGANSAELKDVETFSAVLALAVVPNITGKGNVSLSIDVRRELFDFTRKVEGFPPKITKSAKTTVVLADGATVAIGGISTEQTSESSQRVPLLSRIPILGALFKNKQSASSNRELLIFITPKVIKNVGEKPEIG